jgi:hypothetical protein
MASAQRSLRLALPVLLLALGFAFATGQTPAGVALSAGYAEHSYGSARFSFAGLRLGLQAPLVGALKFGLRVYQMEPRHAEVDRGIAGDAGLVLGVGSRRGDLALLFGFSQVGIQEDDAAGGLGAHVGLQARVWFGPVGLFGEVIDRELFFGTRGHVANLGIGAALRL